MAKALNSLNPKNANALPVGTKPADIGAQEKLTGTAGQVVGFGAGSAAEAQDWLNNENLLSNWYLGDPVTIGRKIAGWDTTTNTISINTASRYTSVVSPKDTNFKRFIQVHNGQSLQAGRTYTGSLLARVNVVSGGPGVRFTSGPSSPPAGTGSSSRVLTVSTGFELYTITYTPGSDVVNWGFEIIGTNLTTAYFNIDIVAWKVELGAVQTLAHKENGKWVLNAPPPDKNLETLRCCTWKTVSGQTVPCLG